MGHAQALRAPTGNRHPVGSPATEHAALIADLHDRLAGAERALANARVIGMAMGIVMERHRCTPSHAFAELARISQNHNTRLAVLAEELVQTGTIAVAPELRGRIQAPQNSGPAL